MVVTMPPTPMMPEPPPAMVPMTAKAAVAGKTMVPSPNLVNRIAARIGSAGYSRTRSRG